MRKSILALTASLAAMSISTAASAATIIIAYDGTLKSGTDEGGVLGTAGADITGLAYSAVFTLTYPTAGAIEDGNGLRHNYYGGSAYGVDSPITAVFTIGGIDFVANGDYFGQFFKRNEEHDLDQVYAAAEDRDQQGDITSYRRVYSNLYSYTNNITSTTAFEEQINYSFQSGDSQFGNFEFGLYDSQQRVWTDRIYGQLAPESVSVMLAGGVPEPATWAFLILGFGAVGGALRRKNGQRRTVRISYS